MKKLIGLVLVGAMLLSAGGNALAAVSQPYQGISKPFPPSVNVEVQCTFNEAPSYAVVEVEKAYLLANKFWLIKEFWMNEGGNVSGRGNPGVYRINAFRVSQADFEQYLQEKKTLKALKDSAAQNSLPQMIELQAKIDLYHKKQTMSPRASKVISLNETDASKTVVVKLNLPANH